MNKKAKITLIVVLSIFLVFLTSFLTIKIYKAYAIHEKYRTCLIWEYNFNFLDNDNYKKTSVAVIDEPYGFEGTKKYVFDSGSYLLVYPNNKMTYYCVDLNCSYTYENGELVSMFFSIRDFPGENYVTYKLQ